MFDFPKASQLQKVAAEIYANGGIVAAVCHGPSILAGILDTTTGKPIIQGKKVTGFAKKGEEQAIPSLKCEACGCKLFRAE